MYDYHIISEMTRPIFYPVSHMEIRTRLLYNPVYMAMVQTKLSTSTGYNWMCSMLSVIEMLKYRRDIIGLWDQFQQTHSESHKPFAFCPK